MADVIIRNGTNMSNGLGPNLDNDEDDVDILQNLPANSSSSALDRVSGLNVSPRYEAFVMTGEKMLRLNPKISPNFAKIKQSELPIHAEILDSPEKTIQQSPFGPFPAQALSAAQRRRQQMAAEQQKADELYQVPSSTSENLLSADGAPSSDSDSKASCVTVNALCATEWVSGDMVPPPVYPAVVPLLNGGSKSEPVSPAHFACSSVQQDDQYRTVVTLPDSEERLGTNLSASPLRERLQALEQELGRGVSQKEPDYQAATRLAKRLYLLDGFKRSDVVRHLCKNNDFSTLVAREFVKHFSLSGLRVDAALRLFLAHFHLTGESSERERVLQFFSARYHECNPGVLPSEGHVHTLAVSLCLLNADLHGENVGTRMSCHDFIENISQMGYEFSRDLLKSLYQSIKNHPIEVIRDRSDSETSDSGLPTQRSDSRMLEIPDPDAQVEYKKGYVLRKCVMDADGRKTPKGRRGWKMFYGTIKGLVLYLHKDENGFKKGAYQTFQNSVRLHHALATPADDYHKRQHVFRLQTADLSEYLFRTSDMDELNTWIEALNFVAACFSAPPLPAAVGSQSTQFHRPLLPSSPSKNTTKEQLAEHEKRVAELYRQVDRHRVNAPMRTAKARDKQSYAEVEIYMLSELRRYQTYVTLLRRRLTNAEFLDGSNSSLNGEPSMREVDEHGSEMSASMAASGQSDRHSYKAAIHNSAAVQHPSYESSF